MMTMEAFKSSLSDPQPPEEISELLKALWYERKDNWEKAHSIAQDTSSADGSWIHAYLHRVEGDLGNAGYWYQRAGKPVALVSHEEEWEQIVTALLTRATV